MGHLERADRNKTKSHLVGHSTFEFFRTGSFCRAVAVGLGIESSDIDSVCDSLPGEFTMPPGTSTVAVHTYQTINHGVEEASNALECGACHASYSNGGTPRMDLAGELGYELKGSYATAGARSDTCTACHEAETKNEGNYFFYIHDKHVRDKGKDCSVCQNFSRPQRGLSTSIGKEDD